MKANNRTAIVIGAGIVGLAHALELSKHGYAVQVFERNAAAYGASIRNFGMVWPVGQPAGTLYNRAMRSRAVWKDICNAAGLWYSEAGSLHLAHHPLEATAMQEIAAVYEQERRTVWLNKAQTIAASPAANPQDVLGSLWSPTEMILESRVAIAAIALWLQEAHAVRFHFNTAITAVDGPVVFSGKQKWQADLILVCSGADFETLFPEAFAATAITKCKLQMMRLAAPAPRWTLGPAVCGGLSLIHYKSFEAAPSLPVLKGFYEHHMPEYLQWGIHVMACQNGEGAITIGDTHEYGLHLDPFDKQYLNDLVLDYLKKFCLLPQYQLQQSWNGTYAKMKDGRTEWIQQLSPVCWVVNGLGGAGMTLSFGLAQDVLPQIGAV